MRSLNKYLAEKLLINKDFRGTTEELDGMVGELYDKYLNSRSEREYSQSLINDSHSVFEIISVLIKLMSGHVNTDWEIDGFTAALKGSTSWTGKICSKAICAGNGSLQRNNDYGKVLKIIDEFLASKNSGYKYADHGKEGQYACHGCRSGNHYLFMYETENYLFFLRCNRSKQYIDSMSILKKRID